MIAICTHIHTYIPHHHTLHTHTHTHTHTHSYIHTSHTLTYIHHTHLIALITISWNRHQIRLLTPTDNVLNRIQHYHITHHTSYINAHHTHTSSSYTYTHTHHTHITHITHTSSHTHHTHTHTHLHWKNAQHPSIAHCCVHEYQQLYPHWEG